MAQFSLRDIFRLTACIGACCVALKLEPSKFSGLVCVAMTLGIATVCGLGVRSTRGLSRAFYLAASFQAVLVMTLSGSCVMLDNDRSYRMSALAAEGVGVLEIGILELRKVQTGWLLVWLSIPSVGAVAAAVAAVIRATRRTRRR